MAGKFRLSVRTSMLAVYSDSTGAIGLFELSSQFASTGALCAVLAKIAGVRFDDQSQSLWSQARDRFTFKDRAYTISAPHGDIRVAPVEDGAVYAETVELLDAIKEQLVPRWQSRRTRFYRT